MRNRSYRIVLVVLLLCLAAFAQNVRSAPPHPTVVFMTDFGHVDDSVAICKGVMLGIAPDLRIVDLTHDVAPFNVLEAARFLAGTTPYYPAGTVFVVVVDPGVGSSRKAIIAKSTRGQYFVLPDNGLLTMVADQDPITDVYVIQNPAWMLGGALSSTFHGRDIFSPVGARLARGENPELAGRKMDPAGLLRLDIHKPVLSAQGISATVIDTDGPFGNLVTNIKQKEFAKLGYNLGEQVSFTLDGKPMEIPFFRTYSDVPVGSPLFYIDSRGRLGLAINQGSFAERYSIKPPVALEIHAHARKN